MAKKAFVTDSENLSGAIRVALLKLGIYAPAKSIAAEVSKNVALAKRVKAIGDDWDNYVSGQRRRLRGRTTSKKPTSRYSGGSDNVTIGDILDVGKIRKKLKDPDDLGEVIKLIVGLGSPPKIAVILEKYCELMAKYGDESKAVEFLTTIQEIGLTN